MRLAKLFPFEVRLTIGLKTLRLCHTVCGGGVQEALSVGFPHRREVVWGVPETNPFTSISVVSQLPPSASAPMVAAAAPPFSPHPVMFPLSELLELPLSEVGEVLFTPTTEHNDVAP